jgi:large subunit ribosomal protein L30
MADARMIKVTQVRSAIGTQQRQRDTLRTLGLRRRGKTVIVRDSPATQGRIRAVAHLIKVEE